MSYFVFEKCHGFDEYIYFFINVIARSDMLALVMKRRMGL